MKPINIEILGVSEKNKGAMLMLEAIVARLGARYPGARFAVPLTIPFAVRARHGLWATFPAERGKRDLSPLLGRVPRKLRRAVGLLAEREIDVVLDASGFAYGDYWGLRKLERRLGKRLARHKPPVAVVLPQALGPFSKPGMAKAFAELARHADRVFARDEVSLKHARAAAPGAEIALAPDFTNLFKPRPVEGIEAYRGLTLVCPNIKMVDKQPADVGEAYVAFMVHAIERSQAAGHRLAYLLHETSGDRIMMERIRAASGIELPVIDEPSAAATKTVIAGARMLIASRFHAVVSGLSSGVPVATTGWTHKYAELMKDYACPEALIDYKDRAAGAAAFDSLLAAEAGDELRRRIVAAGTIQRQRSETMWAEVEALIDERCR